MFLFVGDSSFALYFFHELITSYNWFSYVSYVKYAAIYPATAYAVPQLQTVLPDSDPTNTTVRTPTIFLVSFSVDHAIYLGIHLQIFIGNLDPNVTEDELKQICIQFGELIYVKIPVGKGCGFVQYAAR